MKFKTDWKHNISEDAMLQGAALARNDTKKFNENEKISNFIKKHRLGKGYTTREFGARLGVTPRCVRHWEDGGTLPSFVFILPMAELLGVTPVELLTGSM